MKYSTKILPSLFNISLHNLFFFFLPTSLTCNQPLLKFDIKMPSEIIFTMLFCGNIFIIITMMNVNIYIEGS